MPFPSLSAHQGKVVDHTTIWLSFNFVSLTITKASLSGEWQLRVTHTPLPFINHVHQKFSRALCAEHLGPRKVTRLQCRATGGTLALTGDRNSLSPSLWRERVRRPHSAAGAFLD